jgi:hypothetical protein
MWFVLGLVGLTLACVGFVFWRGDAGWRGDLRVGGCQAKAQTHKGKLRGVTVGARTNCALDFELKREGAFDRFAKGIGLAVEGQVGRARFDDEFYLLADDPPVVAHLRGHPDVTDALRELFELRSMGVEKVKRVLCRNGIVRVEVACAGDAGEATRVAGDFAPQVVALAQRLGEIAAGAPSTHRLWWRTVALVAIASGLAANGARQALRVGFGAVPNTLDDGQLWAIALPIALLIVAALGAATVFLLGRTSRAHVVLAEVLLVGGLGAGLTAVSEVRDFNMEMDASPPAVHATTVIDRTMHRGRRGRRSYSVTLAAWDGSHGAQKLGVSQSDYDRYAPGTPVTVTTRAGYLHLAWLEKFEMAAR